MTQYARILITLFIEYFQQYVGVTLSVAVGGLCVGIWFPGYLGSAVGLMMEISRMNSILEKVKNDLIWPSGIDVNFNCW